jgi:hypothetical protein
MCWYSDSRKVIEQIFGDDADLFCDILAATSPRKQVKSNWNVSVRIYESFKGGGGIPKRGLMPCHIGNIERALRGEPLSGLKVSAFAANLKGDLDRVTIDIWVLRFLKIPKDKLTDKQYLILERDITARAKRRGMKPAQYQAEIWAKVQRQWGKSPRSYRSVSDIDQLKFAFME